MLYKFILLILCCFFSNVYNTGVLHVPINVPALGVSTNKDDVNVNRELVAHGISNAVSGLFGTVQSKKNHKIILDNDFNDILIRLSCVYKFTAFHSLWR